MVLCGSAPLTVGSGPGGAGQGLAGPGDGGLGLPGLGLEEGHLLGDLGDHGPGRTPAVAHGGPAELLQDITAPPRLTQHAERVETRPTPHRGETKQNVKEK